MAAGKYTADVLTFNEDQDLVTTTYTDQRFPLLMYRERDGRGYRFVKFDNGTGDVASAAGSLCYLTATNGTVTSDESDSLAPCGVFQSVIADGSYGWVQTKGLYATVKTSGDDDIVVGDALIETATDGAVSRINSTYITTTAATLAQIQRVVKVVGYAVAADVDANNTVAAVLTFE